MIEENCSICNTVTGNEYLVTNGRRYLACSEDCLTKIEEMKFVLHHIEENTQRYGPWMFVDEIEYLLDGYIKPVRTRGYVKELIKQGYLVKVARGAISLVNPNSHESNSIKIIQLK